VVLAKVTKRARVFMRFKISSESRSAVESVGDAVCGRRKFSTIYIDHTEGSKKTNSGWESYADSRTS